MPAESKTTPTPLAEISHGPSNLELFLDRNQKRLVAALVLLSLIFGAIVLYSAIQKSHETNSSKDLAKANDEASFQSIIDTYPKTAAAQSAKLLLAEAKWDKGQHDSAIQILKDFIQTQSQHNVLPNALASLGAKYMTQNKTDEAVQTFETLIANPNAAHLAPFALLSIGDIEANKGNLDQAKASYHKIETTYTESQFAAKARQRIEQLKAKAPTPVAAPPQATPTLPSQNPFSFPQSSKP